MFSRYPVTCHRDLCMNEKLIVIVICFFGILHLPVCVYMCVSLCVCVCLSYGGLRLSCTNAYCMSLSVMAVCKCQLRDRLSPSEVP